MSRSLCTSPLRALPARINPKSKLMEVINADGSVTHAINQMLAYVWRKVIPALNPEELAAKHDSSQFIAESLGFFRVCSRAEYPSQLKKLLLLAFFRRDAVLNEFDRHAFGTESTGFRQVANLRSNSCGKADTLPYCLVRSSHSTSTHHNGAFGKGSTIGPELRHRNAFCRKSLEACTRSSGRPRSRQ